MPPGPPAGQGGSPAKVVAVVGVVIALIAAGVVGWQFFWPRGGADSPEQAVEQLMLSAAAQDPVGMLDMMSPAEVDGLDDVYDAARERAEEEGLIEDEGITDALDLELSELEFEVDELGDDLARVTLVGGRYDVSWDPDKLPERLDFLAERSEEDSESGDLEDAFDGDEPFVTTVRIDGRWYVTLLGSFADVAYRDGAEEAADGDLDLAEPDYDLAGEDVDAITGEDPEEVVENLVEAVNDGSVEDLLAHFPEDLTRPLRPYAPVIEGLQEEGGWGSEVGLEVSVEDLGLSTEELDGDAVKVVIEQGTFYGSVWEDDDHETGSMVVEGDCVTFEDGSGPETSCLSDNPTLEDLGIDEFFFVVSEVDGGYQLDPLATAVEYTSILVDSFSADMVEDLIEDLEDEFGHDVGTSEEF
jgi:hypothetical protein